MRLFKAKAVYASAAAGWPAASPSRTRLTALNESGACAAVNKSASLMARQAFVNTLKFMNLNDCDASRKSMAMQPIVPHRSQAIAMAAAC